MSFFYAETLIMIPCFGKLFLLIVQFDYIIGFITLSDSLFGFSILFGEDGLFAF